MRKMLAAFALALLSTVAAHAASVSLTWNPSTDNVGVAGYNIYRGGVKIGSSVTTAYVDSTDAASTQYTYTVAAFDAAGNESGQSQPVVVTTLAGPPPPSGTAWYVRSGASGNGSSWSSAWGNLSSIGWSSLHPGDTVCVAGGSFSGSLSVGASGTVSSPIQVKRATAADAVCGSSTPGWSAAYDAQVILNGGSIVLSHNYVTIDGMVWNGIKVVMQNPSGEFDGITVSGATTGITVRNVESAGPCADGQGCSQNGDHRNFDMSSWNGSNWDTSTNMLLQYVNLHGACNNLVVYGADNLVIEHSRLADSNTTGNTANCHPNLANAGGNSVVFRYNEITNWQVEGIMNCPNGACSSQWDIYGNVFHDPMAGSFPRVLTIQGGTSGPYRVYNNTFVGLYFECAANEGGSWSSGTEGKNNLLVNSGSSCGVPNEANDASAASSVFVNAAGGDYHLKGPLPGGSVLASPYNKDSDGNVRGADGVWDIGAYEFK